MKSKVKNSQKDINIVIEIENNLFSKNKMKSEDDVDKKNTVKDKTSKQGPSLNRASQNILSDYLAITSARDLYNSNRTQPLNLTQYLSRLEPMPVTPSITTQTPATPSPAVPAPVSNDNSEFQEAQDSFVENENDEPETDESLFEIISDVDEVAFINTLTSNQKIKRKNAIERLQQPSEYRITKKAIKKYKLAKYVKTLRPEIWEQIQYGTWIY